jgi:hypothetical protein
MATYTSNYGWTKPSGSDNVDISVLNNNLDDQDSTIHDAFLNMAPPFSESSTYAVDDIVLYTTGLYKCHTAVVTPGSWTGSTNWQVYKLSEGGSGGGGTSNYNDLTNKPSINGVTLSGNKTTGDLGINADNVMMSDGVTSVEEKMGNVRMTKLWENPSPSADFAGQAVTLSSGNYDLLLVIAKYATTFGNNLSNVSSSSGDLTFPLAGSSGPANYTRSYSVNMNVVTFGDSEISAHNSPSKVTANNTLIPYQIYGIKLT